MVAHRGAWSTRSEQNTLAAFERAAAIGADAVELDVRRTADGRIVVVHDARIGGRPVGRLALAQLRERLAPGQAPLLEEALERLAGEIAVDVELKDGGCVAEAMAIVARHLDPAGSVVTSFRDSVLAEVARVAPEARTGLLLGPHPALDRLEARLRRVGAAFVAPRVRRAPSPILDWAADHGHECWAWTVNDAQALGTVLDAPAVGAVITDRPDRALALVGRRPAVAVSREP